MGERRRYGRGDGAVDAEAEAEARALRTIAGLIQSGTSLITDREVAIRAGEVLRAAATELYAGRAVPLPVRRAVRDLANAIRIALDPRPSSSHGRPAGPDDPRSAGR